MDSTDETPKAPFTASRRRSAWLAALVGFGLGLSACAGGAASPGVARAGSISTTTTLSIGSSSSAAPTTESLLQFSQCMRAHGVANFPDPTALGDGPPGRNSFLGNGPNPSTSPLYQKAAAACGKYAHAERVTPAAAAQVFSEQLSYARCLRAHGEPDFPDPSANGGFSVPKSIEEDSPSFRAAEAACQNFQPRLPGLPTSGQSR